MRLVDVDNKYTREVVEIISFGYVIRVITDDVIGFYNGVDWIKLSKQSGRRNGVATIVIKKEEGYTLNKMSTVMEKRYCGNSSRYSDCSDWKEE